MHIKVLDDSSEIANTISDLIIEDIKEKPNLLLCAATGGTPTQMYQLLVAKKALYTSDQLRVIKLDEWGGVPMESPETCESYLQKHILKPLKIHENNYFGFNSNSPNPKQEVHRIKSVLKKKWPHRYLYIRIGHKWSYSI